MKKGDTVPVNIAGDVVAQAVVESVDLNTRQVTMVVPATRVVMGLRVEVDTAPAPVEEPAKQTLITGVDRVDADGNVISSTTSEPVAAGESAPVVETPQNDENVNADQGAVETPTGEATQTEVKAPEPVETSGE